MTTPAWPDLPHAPLVLVPLGSTEQHGPHLPLHTDTVIAAAVAEGVARRCRAGSSQEGVFVAPAVAYGASGEHQDFPGTISIGQEALRHLLIELIRSLTTWAGRIVVVNAHGGNVEALTAAITQMIHESHPVAWVPCATETVDAHAGHTETSLMLHLAPDEVDMSRAAPGNTAPIGEILGDLVRHGVAHVSPNGVLGDPTTATPEEGARVLDSLVGEVYRDVVSGRADARGRLRHAG